MGMKSSCNISGMPGAQSRNNLILSCPLPLLAVVMALLISGPASGASLQQGLIQDLAKSLSNIASHPARAQGGALVVEAADIPADAAGAFLLITGADGAKAGVARITAVNKDSALCRTLAMEGAQWPAGPLRARGFGPGTRILFIFQAPEESKEARWLELLMQAAGESGVMDVARKNFSYLFSAASPDRLAKAAASAKADLIILPIVDETAGKETFGFSLLDSSGKKLAIFMSGAKNAADVEKNDTQPTTGKPAAAASAPKAVDGFMAGLAEPVRAALMGREPAAVTAESDKDPWDTISVEGKALSAALYYVGGIVARDVAILTMDRLVLAGVGNERAMIKWVSPPFKGVTPLSLAVFDTNGDGREEIFVNAARADGFHSMLFDKTDKGYHMMAGDLPYYFSSTPGWRLIAQKMAADGKKIEGEFFTVTREEGDLRMDPAGIIEGGAPLGLYGFNPDDDGAMELAGVLSDGALAIFAQTGKLLWSAGGLGGGGYKNLGGDDGAPLSAPPRLVALKDKQGRPALAVGKTNAVKGGFLGMGAKNTGMTRIMGVGPAAYSVNKILVAYNSWISDLVDMGGGPLGTYGAPGYVAVMEEKGGSIIYLPLEIEAAEPGRPSSVSSGAPGLPAKDQEER